ncbi:MAG: NAD-dependent epimerase/dehydratase family protein [Nitrospirae bacterium]|nr:MAG: NAD-dependent epimerase/dehydratase family protein [Nitrospirota bacterium]
MKVLVTGGAGFIGSHVVDQLVREGHEVVVVDNLSTGRRKNLNRAARFYKVDIVSDRLKRVLRKERPIVLIHLAAHRHARQAARDPLLPAEVDLLGSLNVLEHAVQYGTRKVIFASSGNHVYGEPHALPVSESHSLRPHTKTGISKLAVEQYIGHYHRHAGIGAVILRLSNVFGPRQRADHAPGVIATFATQMVHGEQPFIHGNGLQTRDYIYVRDVVDAVMAVLDPPIQGTYNVGTGRETTVNEIFRHVKALTQAPCKELHGPARKGEIPRMALDSSKLHEDTGWEPAVSLLEGLEETVRFYQQVR